MDRFYNIMGAAEALKTTAFENKEVNDRRLASLTKDPQWQSKYTIKSFDSPTTMRLVHTKVNDRTAEEAVFTIQGVLSGKNLPPVVEKIKTISQARYLRQGVTLIGCETPTFKEAIDAAREIYGMFDRNVQDTSLEPWSLPSSPITQGTTLEASNRYLTSKRDAPGAVSVPIPATVDPRGILENLTKEGYLYTEENEVQYYRVHKNSEGINRVETVGPQIFRVGDIVELQISFIVAPLKNNKHKMIVVLRSIALLDPSFSQKALICRMQEPEVAQQLTLKRRVGYEHFTEDEANGMEIDKHVDQRQKT